MWCQVEREGLFPVARDAAAVAFVPMDATVTRLDLPQAWDEDTPTGRAFRDYVEFIADVREHHYGTRAVAPTPAEVWGLARGDAARRCVIVVARAGGRIVGRVIGWLPLLESTTMIEGGWDMDPALTAQERELVAAALLDAVEALADAEGRPWLVLEALCRPGPLVPTSGVGSVDPSHPDAAAFLARGFTLEQVYRYQVAELSALTGLNAALAAAAAPGYRLVTWAGRTPAEHRATFCTLASIMSAEVPTGGVEFESQVWDDARLAEFEGLLERAGRTNVVTVALAADGEPAGYTELAVTPGPCGVQGDTLVVPAHRGHGLGRWLKLANLARVRAEFPRITHVITDNAEDNVTMLAINEAIGFRTALREAMWQRKPPHTAGT